VLAAAFGLGLVAIWFVEIFNRQAPLQTPASTTVIMPRPGAACPAQQGVP
jgi:hypothetical protein